MEERLEKLHGLFEYAACEIYDEAVMEDHKDLINNFENGIRELVCGRAETLVRQGVPQPVFACGAMLQKNEKVKLATGYRFADSENEAKGMFLTTIRSNPEYDSYSILDINCTEIEMPASKSA